MAIVPTNLGPALNNLDTGAELLLPDKPMVKRTAAGMLVWSTGKPSACVLYSPERFVKLAVAAPDKVEKPAVRDQSKPTKRIPPTD